MPGISDFKSNFNGGARPNLFKVRINFPGGDKNTMERASFMIKAAQLPSSVIGQIEVPFRGRKLKVAGDRTFEPWTITVINDTAFDVRNAFELWMDRVNSHSRNISADAAVGQHLNYYADMEVIQLDRDGNEDGIKNYTFIDAFPTNIGAIDLNYETNDAVEEFTVELQYQYWMSNTTT
jgi:hypothetical protein